MANNRRLAETKILEFLQSIEFTGYNVKQYKSIFANMTDQQFHKYMLDIQAGKAFIVLFKPMGKAQGITVENNLKVAAKYGLDFFQKLVFTNDANIPDYKTPIKYLIVDLPYRRQSQNLVKKINIPENNKVIDELTYQPTGPSKGSKISFPELQVLIGMGLENTITELIQFRGGDRGGFNAYNSMFLRYGSANLKTLNQYSTGTESTKTLKKFLVGMHINSTL